MQLIRNADTLRAQLECAITEENRLDLPVGPVSAVVRASLLGAMKDYDPEHLVRVGMLAVVRDMQDWAEANMRDDETGKLLGAYLLAALITAGGVEDPTGVHPVDPPVSDPDAETSVQPLPVEA